MSELLMHDPTDRKLWDFGMGFMVWYWWVFGLFALIVLAIAVSNAAQMPVRYWQVQQFDAITAGTPTDAKIFACHDSIIGFTDVHYNFTSQTGESGGGMATYWGGCADYPLGASLPIRYLSVYPPPYPPLSAASGEIGAPRLDFITSLIMLALEVLAIGILGRFCIMGAVLASKGRLRIGHIISAKPLLWLGRRVRYEVTADDGTVLDGKRIFRTNDIIPDLVAGAPIPVLYASKRIHWPFGISTRNVPPSINPEWHSARLVDPKNRDLLANPRKRIPYTYGSVSPLLLILPMLAGVVLGVLLLDQSLDMKGDHDAFLARSVVTQAEIVECSPSSAENMIHVSYTFTDANQEPQQGSALYEDTCAAYPLGTPISIRYDSLGLRSPEALDEEYWEDQQVRWNLLMLGLFLLNLLLHGFGLIKPLRLRAKGELRHGRVVSVTRRFFHRVNTLHYEVLAADGSVAAQGKLPVEQKHLSIETPAGTPLAVLYLDPRTHFVL